MTVENQVNRTDEALSGADAKRHGINVFSSIGARILQITVLIWVNKYLLERIDADEYSLFPLIMSLLVFIQFLSTIVTGGVARDLIVADSQNDSDGLTRITTSMLPVLIGMSLVIGGLGALVIWRIEDVLVIEAEYIWEAQVMLELILFYVCFNLISTPFSSGLYVRQKFAAINGIMLLSEVVRSASVFMLLMFVSTRVLWVVVATVLSELTNTILLIIATQRIFPDIRFESSKYCRATMQRLVGFGGWMSMTGIADFISKTVPVLLLNQFSTSAQVAAFHLGRLPDMQLRKIISAAEVPFQPALTRSYALEGSSSVPRLFLRGNRYCLWMSCFLIAPLIALSDSIIGLYTNNLYSEAAVVMALMFIRYPFIFATAMFYRMSYATGNVKAFFVGQIVLQLVSLCAMYFVSLKGWGAIGMGASICGAEIVLHLMLIYQMSLTFVKCSWQQFISQSVIPGVIPFAGALVFCLLARWQLDVQSWVMVGLISVGSALIYIAALVVFCFDEVDRELVGRGMAKLRSRFDVSNRRITQPTNQMSDRGSDLQKDATMAAVCEVDELAHNSTTS